MNFGSGVGSGARLIQNNEQESKEYELAGNDMPLSGTKKTGMGQSTILSPPKNELSAAIASGNSKSQIQGLLKDKLNTAVVTTFKQRMSIQKAKRNAVPTLAVKELESEMEMDDSGFMSPKSGR